MGKSYVGTILREFAEKYNLSRGTDVEDFEKLAELQLRDHEDIKLLINSVAYLRREIDSMKASKSKTSCKVYRLE